MGIDETSGLHFRHSAGNEDSSSVLSGPYLKEGRANDLFYLTELA